MINKSISNYKVKFLWLNQKLYEKKIWILKLKNFKNEVDYLASRLEELELRIDASENDFFKDTI